MKLFFWGGRVIDDAKSANGTSSIHDKYHYIIGFLFPQVDGHLLVPFSRGFQVVGGETGISPCCNNL